MEVLINYNDVPIKEIREFIEKAIKRVNKTLYKMPNKIQIGGITRVYYVETLFLFKFIN